MEIILPFFNRKSFGNQMNDRVIESQSFFPGIFPNEVFQAKRKSDMKRITPFIHRKTPLKNKLFKPQKPDRISEKKRFGIFQPFPKLSIPNLFRGVEAPLFLKIGIKELNTFNLSLCCLFDSKSQIRRRPHKASRDISDRPIIKTMLPGEFFQRYFLGLSEL